MHYVIIVPTANWQCDSTFFGVLGQEILSFPQIFRFKGSREFKKFSFLLSDCANTHFLFRTASLSLPHLHPARTSFFKSMSHVHGNDSYALTALIYMHRPFYHYPDAINDPYLLQKNDRTSGFVDVFFLFIVTYIIYTV